MTEVDNDQFVLLENKRDSLAGTRSPKFHDPSRSLDVSQNIYKAENTLNFSINRDQNLAVETHD